MDDLLFARSQMALSLGFHIIFAAIGMTMPFLMAISHFFWLKRGTEHSLILTKAWMRGVAILFATGAVSGTVLSFELGLLWPKFMSHAGAIIGMPFSLEGTAFFIEAIALGFYLYGWQKLKPWVHWAMGVVVGISGVCSGIFVVCANAWMNSPAGFDWNNGNPINIDPFAAMFNAASFSQCLHMVIAAFVATSFAVAGVHAMALMKNPKSPLHREALKIALCVGSIFAILQPLSGDISAKDVAKRQPLKLAAMESHFETQRGAPLIVGGMPNLENETVEYAIEIPKALSFLAFGDFDAEVKGLKEFPRENWPPVRIVHTAFQIMVGLGTFLAGLSAISLFLLWKKKEFLFDKRFLKAVAVAGPCGFIALEAGWTVTEVGRQPWIIYNVLKTKDAVTPMPGLWLPFMIYMTVYLMLCVVVIHLLRRQFKHVG